MIKLRKPWLIRPAGTVVANVLTLLMGTVRQRIAIAGSVPIPPPPGTEPTLFVFWHEFTVLCTAFRGNVHILTSLHADGELMTRVFKHLKLGVIRGSATRGGAKALLGLLRRGGASHVILTPDGPVGPRRQVKVGAVALAGMSGMPIVPVGIACPIAWRAGSWDRMVIPLPWATSHFVVGPSIRVPAGLDRTAMNRYCRQVEDGLETVTAAADRWAAGGPRPTPAAPLSACA